MGFTIRFTGFRKFLFPPTTAGFKKWCIEVRKSRAFLKQYPFMLEESRERYATEYTERKLLPKRLSGFMARLDAKEVLSLNRCLSGGPLDLRDASKNRMYYEWVDQQRNLIAGIKNLSNGRLVGTMMKQLRVASGFSKTEMGFFLGVSCRTYKGYEEGKSKSICGFVAPVFSDCYRFIAPQKTIFVGMKGFKNVTKTL